MGHRRSMASWQQYSMGRMENLPRDYMVDCMESSPNTDMGPCPGCAGLFQAKYIYSTDSNVSSPTHRIPYSGGPRSSCLPTRHSRCFELACAASQRIQRFIPSTHNSSP